MILLQSYIKRDHSGIKSNHVLLVPHYIYIQANGQLFKSHQGISENPDILICFAQV